MLSKIKIDTVHKIIYFKRKENFQKNHSVFFDVKSETKLNL